MKKIMNKISAGVKRRPILSAVVILVVLVTALLLVQIKPSDNNQVPSSTNTNQPISKVAKISITKNGFEPSTLTIDKGTKIIWVNTDKELHQVASDSHPDHKDVPGLHSELLNQDQSYEYTPENSGQIHYHDESSPSHGATIIVN